MEHLQKQLLKKKGLSIACTTYTNHTCKQKLLVNLVLINQTC